MSSQQERLQIIIEWFEKNPEAYKEVQKSIEELDAVHQQAINSYLDAGKASTSNAKDMDNLDKVYTKNYLTIAGSLIPQVKEMIDIGKEQEKTKSIEEKEEQKRIKEEQRLRDKQAKAEQKRIEDSHKRVGKLGHSLSAVGMRVGWMGYRLVMMGKMIMRWMIAPAQKAVSVLKDWDKSLVDVAYAYGLLSYTGQVSDETLSSLQDTMMKLPEAGIQMQAALGLLEGVMATIAVDMAPTLSSALILVGESLMRIWEAVSPTLIPALEDLVTTALIPLLGVLERNGGALINVVEGMVSMTTAMLTLIPLVEPFIPSLAYLAGTLIPLAPLFMAIGIACYFLSPILMVIGSLVKILGAAGLGMGTMLTTVLPLIAGLVAAVTVWSIAFQNLLDAGFSPVQAAILALIPAVLVGVGVFLLVSKTIAFFAGTLAATAPTVAASGTAMGTGLAAMAPAIPVILTLTAAVIGIGVAFLAAGAGISLASGGLVALVNNLPGLGQLALQLPSLAAGITMVSLAGVGMLPAIANVNSMTLALSQMNAQAVGMERLNMAMGAGGVGGMGTQNVTIYSTVTVGSVSAEVDLRQVETTVNKALADALRRTH